jgi:hypothetical protein
VLLAALGADAMPMIPGEFRKFVLDEIAESARVIRVAGIEAQQPRATCRHRRLPRGMRPHPLEPATRSCGKLAAFAAGALCGGQFSLRRSR